MVWAKSVQDTNTKQITHWLPLTQHLDDTGAVAARLWDEWLPNPVRQHIAAGVGGDQADGRLLLTFLAAVHDVGKASPAFAVQVPRLADRMRAAGLAMPADIPNEERRQLRHELAGEVILESWLADVHRWSVPVAQQVGVVVGGHHGVPPEPRQLRYARMRARSGLLGTSTWTDVQRHLVERAARRASVSDRFASWQEICLSQPAQVLLTGVVIVADWIASNSELFPLAPIDNEQPVFDQKERLERAWSLLELPKPWEAAHPKETATAVLRSRFGLPGEANIRPVQQAAFETAQAMDLPGLMVIEAPMGEGKTEAALLAAEVLAARTGAAGCFVALPTQATTDAMFARVLSWLSRLPDARLADDAQAGRNAHAVTLAHGKATMNATFRDLRMMRGQPQDVAADDDDWTGEPRSRQQSIEAVVHSWISGRKKGPLADFVVGTIDQLLFTSLRARHLALRHLGLASKVVIIDEAHAYDSYMNVYLTRAAEWLGAYGAPVILLSATLPEATRSELIDAYQAGADSAANPGARVHDDQQWGWAPPSDELALPVGEAVLTYPAITTRTAGVASTVPVGASSRSAVVHVETADDDLDLLGELLDDTLGDRGCALVVRNTVTRAQQTAESLRERFGDDVEIAHSRFIGHDRMAKDESLRRRFGPPDHGAPGDRPQRAVVVATQVVEQSLDVDFDLLITDLAPIDLLLQRIGRMHRHMRGTGEQDRPSKLRTPRCVVTGVHDWSGEPPEPVRGSSYVYGEHSLYRAAALIGEIVRGAGTIRLPGDIAPLVQRAYGDGVLGHPAWQDAMAKAREDFDRRVASQRSSANTFRLAAPMATGEPILGWLDGRVDDVDDTPQGQAEVRDSKDSLEVIMLLRAGDQLKVPDWVERHGGWLTPLNEAPSDTMARAIAGCSIRLPAYVTQGASGDLLIKALEANWYPHLQAHRLLAGQLILELDDDGRGTYGPWSFSYSARNGLEVARNG